METLTLDLPAMYGDHHVLEVRRILLEIPGVADVYASSAFRVAEIKFDPAQVGVDTITSRLDEAGYTGELGIPYEAGVPVTEVDESRKNFRHTAAFAATGNTVGFHQEVAYNGRPLWPCPGMGPLSRMDEGG